MKRIALILAGSLSLLVVPSATATSLGRHVADCALHRPEGSRQALGCQVVHRDRLDRRAVTALETVSGAPITVNCRLQRPEALGHAFFAARVIGVRTWVCRRMNALVLDAPEPYTPDSYLASWAVLILTHEAVHLSDYSGAHDEALTECRAIQLVRDVARAAGVSDEVAVALGHEALRYDAKLPGYGDYRVGLGLIANYHATGCQEGGPLDIHPDSTDWPN
jgi:hypothetical protein